MKKSCHRIFCVIVLSLTLETVLLAQVPLRIGPQAGLNFANVTRSGFPEGVSFTNKVRTGIVVGAVGEWSLSDLFFLQFEPQYVQKGANASETFYFFDEEFTSTAVVKFDYVTLPVLLKLRIPAPGIKPYVFTGPNVSLRVSAKVESGGQTRDYKDLTKAYDLAIDIGAGVEQGLAPLVSLLVDLRFSLGLTNVTKPQSANDATTWKSRDFKFSATILFGL